MAKNVKVVEVPQTGWLGMGGGQLRKVERITARMIGEGFELVSQTRSSWNQKITLTFVRPTARS